MQKEKNKIFIIGAGSAAKMLLREIKSNHLNYNVVAFIDDDKRKINKKIRGIKIIGPISRLPSLIRKYKIKEILIAIPSANSQLIRRIFQISQRENIKSKIIPRTIDIIRGLVRFENVREIEPQDLLGRPVVKHDLKVASKKLREKIVLITGAAGSIGSELVRQMVILRPKKIICFDWWENGTFYLENKLKPYNYKDVEYIIGNIQDEIKVEQIIRQYKPAVIFHAAAYKHVPLMENNISEAVKNNIIGTENLARKAIEYKVKDFILISTDKAINPSSIMGATKRVTEKLMYFYADSQNVTRFTAVRFGNVLASNGSVISIFEKQIKEGGPVTVTHPDMIRYFMSTEEAVQLIIQSWVLGKNGEIFILDMGEPIKIKNLADNLIRAYGYIPNKDIKIKFIGSRPGEKLYEEIFLGKEKFSKTTHPKIFIVKKEENLNYDTFLSTLDRLKSAITKIDINKKEILRCLKDLIPNFKHE